MYEIFVETHFSAAHHLRGYRGDCARPHGHNWIVEVHVRCAKLNEIGIGVDFRDVKKAVKEVLTELDHRDLNELTPFKEVNPTSENIAAYLYHELNRRLSTPDLRISMVKASETPGCGACYWQE